MKIYLLLASLALVLVLGCLKTDNRESSKYAETPFYVPPEPNAPLTHHEALGQVHQDKDELLTIHAIAADRRIFYEMFPTLARQYVLNVNQLWFWGDGTSTQGAFCDHTYADEGAYQVTLRTEVSFRGGATKTIEAKAMVDIAAILGPPVVEIETDLPTEQTDISEPVTYTATLRNTGESSVITNSIVVVNDVPSPNCPWITCVPDELLLRPGEDPQTVSIEVDPSKGSQSGTYTFFIRWKKSRMVRGWYVVYSPPR